MVKRAENNETKKSASKHENAVKYGELIILGYNGQLTTGDKRRRRSKFVLWKRDVPNGIKPSNHYVVPTPQTSQAVLDRTKHSISYTLSRTEAVIVEYVNDENTDMFQVGRSSDTPIDFVVMDTNPDKNIAAINNLHVDNKKGPSASTISRFACRIICDRNNTNIARLYAAGFDSSRNIFLGEKATKWKDCEKIDALTTNGILVMHPSGKFYNGNTKPGIWLEVSVCGKLFSLRGSRSAQDKGEIVNDSDNILTDGTLIDLCGATLLWRSAEGLSLSPSRDYLKKLIERTNRERPTCPVGLYTLVFPHHSEADTVSVASTELVEVKQKQPYVYLSCGHVQGSHEWGLNKGSNNRTCPMCLKIGEIAKLNMGIEASFYVQDKEKPDLYAFNPCGHVATEKTIKFWSNVGIPYGSNGFEASCPFCATLLEGYPGYIKLIFN